MHLHEGNFYQHFVQNHSAIQRPQLLQSTSIIDKDFDRCCLRLREALHILRLKPTPVTENENAKLLWDYGIRTDRVIPANQPGLTLVDKTNNKVSLIDVAVPWD